MASNAEIFPRERKTKLPGGYMDPALDLSSGSLKEGNSPEEPLLAAARRWRCMFINTLTQLEFKGWAQPD
jgi:hypothetical protein